MDVHAVDVPLVADGDRAGFVGARGPEGMGETGMSRQLRAVACGGVAVQTTDRTFNFTADTPDERNEWVAAICLQLSRADQARDVAL